MLPEVKLQILPQNKVHRGYHISIRKQIIVFCQLFTTLPSPSSPETWDLIHMSRRKMSIIARQLHNLVFFFNTCMVLIT